jgi:hypothetical protein
MITDFLVKPLDTVKSNNQKEEKTTVKFWVMSALVLGGIGYAYVAQYIITFGRVSQRARMALAGFYYTGSALAAYLIVLWWQGVVAEKGVSWTLQHYFPWPGLMFAALVLIGQVTIALVLWSLLIRSSKNQTR